jgi:hypothetical protein
MINLVWAVLVAALPNLGGYRGRHRMSWAQQWEKIHPTLPWQRARRRYEAARRAWQRPSKAAHARTRDRAFTRDRAPVRAEDASWAWWQQRRELYRPALTAAGAW